jgi:hypothetical protein
MIKFDFLIKEAILEFVFFLFENQYFMNLTAQKNKLFILAKDLFFVCLNYQVIDF